MEAWKATNDSWPHLLRPIKRQVATAERASLKKRLLCK